MKIRLTDTGGSDTPTFTEANPFKLRTHTKAIAFTQADVANAEKALLHVLSQLPTGGLLPIDFDRVRISSEAARQFLLRAMLRINGGELHDRYLVLGDLNESAYNVQVMLETESLVAVERSDGRGPQLRGDVDPAMRDTYDYLLTVPTATASMVQAALSLGNISTATNRLTNLSKLGVARRIDHRPVAGGGREYVYAPVR